MNNNHQYFEAIYLANYQKVMRLCMGYAAGDKDLANDLAQEVFVKVWDNLSKFRKESQVATWIYRITVNTCLMRLRKKKSYLLKTDLQEELASANEEETGLKELRLKKMYHCIAKLSDRNKTIILMELEGLSQKEIASVMGMNHAAIRTRIHRIKQELSKCVTHGGI